MTVDIYEDLVRRNLACVLHASTSIRALEADVGPCREGPYWNKRLNRALVELMEAWCVVYLRSKLPDLAADLQRKTDGSDEQFVMVIKQEFVAPER